MNEPNVNKTMIIGIIVASVVIFSGLAWALYMAPSEPGGSDTTGQIQDDLAFSDELSPKDGPKNAPVVVRLIGDFQCPACRAAEVGAEYARNKYHEKNVLFVWKDFPLEQIHKNARISANAARCAHDQGWFWSYKNKLYDKQAEWSKQPDPSSAFVDYVEEIEKDKGVGIDEKKFEDCLKNKTFDERVLADIQEGKKNFVQQTPTFFINNRRYFGMSPEDWDRAIQLALDEALKTTTPVNSQ